MKMPGRNWQGAEVDSEQEILFVSKIFKFVEGELCLDSEVRNALKKTGRNRKARRVGKLKSFHIMSSLVSAGFPCGPNGGGELVTNCIGTISFTIYSANDTVTGQVTVNIMFRSHKGDVKQDYQVGAAGLSVPAPEGTVLIGIILKKTISIQAKLYVTING